MTAPRFFIAEALVKDPAGAEKPRPAAEGSCVEGSRVVVPLTDADLHHASSVMRIQPGEHITVADPEGLVWELEVAEVTASGLSAWVRGRSAPLPSPRVTLVQGIAKGPKMDRVIEQAVELGVESIVPVFTERTIVRLDRDKASERGARWRRIAEAAAKQSRGPTVPRVEDPAPLESVLESLAEFDAVLVPWEEADVTVGVRSVLARAGLGDDSRVAVVVGPEGGLSAAEVATLGRVGGVPCSLGRTVLRTETAAVVAIALVTDAMGAVDAAG